MFNSMKMGIALTYLTQDAKAVSYRPTTEEGAPWYKSHDKPGETWRDPTWAVGYSIPNFGKDQEIIATQKSIADAEKEKEPMSATFDAPVTPPRNYFVPNFGVDGEVKDTTSNLAEAEAEEGHILQVDEDSKIKRNYFVPNFGADNEIDTTKENLAQSEKLLGMKMGNDYFKDPKDLKVNYFVPNFGKDNEIATSLDNTEKSETALNHKWTVKESDMIQLDADVQIESDPINSSLGKITQYKYPDLAEDPLAPAKINYPVNNFGADPDMVGTMNSISIGEKMNKHKFVMGTADSKAKWHNVAKDTLYNYYPALDRDVVSTAKHLAEAEDRLGYSMIQIRSDPITDSTGEYTQYTHPEGQNKKWKMNYAVPNFGVDHEVLSDKENVASVEKSLGHEFVPKETAEGHKMNYAVPNFGPDRDIAGTQSSISSAESSLGHTWVPDFNNIQI
jgi:hypothetical protein